MHRCFIEPDAWSPEPIEPPTDELHYLTRVLRLSDGTEVEIADGRGRIGRARLRRDGRRTVLEPIAMGDAPRPRSLAVRLIQAIPKGTRMDVAVEKATELGVNEILPILADRNVKRPDAAGAAREHARWMRLARAAARQCGTAWIPRIAPVTAFADALTAWPEGEPVFMATLGAERPLKGCLRDAAARAATSITFLIGPEGDFTAAEVAAARDRGAITVSLGPLVLRVETAAVFVASAAFYELDSTASRPAS